ncbi:MAG: histidine phosphatase family protein [Flavobacteriales bacterium]|nr:MAG: histidine phosphatase family protein [Flavobacteriales bacterium]
MLTLYLIRHAKSSWDDPLQTDFHRPLNARGLRDAPAMAAHFAARREPVDLLISSPATRALTTSQHVAAALGATDDSIVQEPRLYLADLSTWRSVLNDLPASARSVALFSHNPGISECCEWLSSAGLGELPTCAMVCIDMGVDEWKALARGTGTVRWHDYPKKHPHLQ